MKISFIFGIQALKYSSELLMKTIQLICALVFAPFILSNQALATTAGDFALLDHTGTFHQASYYSDHDAIVILVESSATLQSDRARSAVSKVAAVQQAEKVKAFLLSPKTGDERDALQQTMAKIGSSLPVLIDETQLVTQSLNVAHYGETLVIDPKTMTVLYQGDAAGLTDMADFTAVKASAQPVPAAAGTKINFRAAKAVSYVEDVAPILERNCVSCHRDGGIGPWSMSSHAMVQGWSPMMREVVMTQRMPPGRIDTHVGKKMSNASGLSIAEQQTLIDWIDQGAKRTSDQDPLSELTFDKAEFTIGEPDIVLDVTPQNIPATGVVDYRYVPVQLNLPEDKWLRAIEFVPGDHEVLHHVITYLSSPADKSETAEDGGAGRGENLGGFAPGRQPDEFADNSGRLIPKGSNLLLQMHYTTSGRETVDATRVALYFHDEPPAYVMSGGVAGQRRFMVPPGAKEHKLTGVQEIERDAYLYELNPHMHFRGKYMSYSVQYPDGTEELLLSVPKYDFNWQFNYRLQEPAFLPAGSKVIARGAMDNSAQNLGNPDPSRPVFFGLQTMHEMFFGFMTLRYIGDTPAALAGGSVIESSADSAGR
jgi:hypothetical protein